MATDAKRLVLFGGIRPWKPSEWTAQDDRVRGGSSVSYLIPASDGTTAILNGNLDTRTLGGAGFASQRTTVDKVWDLSPYNGVEVVVKRGGSDEKTNKMFTLVLKDVMPPSYIDENTRRKREQSTISYEATFKPSIGGSDPEERVYLPFLEFKATFRGHDKDDAPPLNPSNIRRFTLMVRSFFDNQSGPFQITLVSISAVTTPARKTMGELRRQDPDGFYDEYDEFDNDHDDHDLSADGDKPRKARTRGSWGCSVL